MILKPILAMAIIMAMEINMGGGYYADSIVSNKSDIFLIKLIMMGKDV